VFTKIKIMTDKEIQLGRELSDTKAALAKLTVENRRLKPRQKKLAVKFTKCVNLDDVVNRNYFANIKRLKISDKTTVRDWLAKINEEVGELIESWDGCDGFDKVELADVTLVCFSMAKHFGINLVDEMEKKMKVNEKRND
jgi:NTP pyrophosphatase (non-canonical NTP hydrolase)